MLFKIYLFAFLLKEFILYETVWNFTAVLKKEYWYVLFRFSLCSGFFVCVIFLDIFFNDDSVTISITT